MASTVAQLKKELKARGLSTEGLKADLLARLNNTPTTKKRVKGGNEVNSNKKQKLEPRQEIIKQLSVLKPETLTLKDVIIWEQRCAVDKLAAAFLNDVVSHASLGLFFLALVNILYSATVDRTCTLKSTRKTPLLWTKLVVTIRQVEEKTKDVSYLLKQLNNENISPNSLIALCQRLNSAKEFSCAGAGHGVLLWSKLRILAEPLMALSNPLPIDLLPLIDAVREAPIVSMDAPAGDHATFTEKWLSFLDRHPAVKAYTDPVFVFVLPASLVADPGLAGTVALFPLLPGAVIEAVPDLGGAPLPGVYTVPGQASADILAYGLRTHYATPPGSAYPGGAGAAQHIIMLNTVAAMVTQV